MAGALGALAGAAFSRHYNSIMKKKSLPTAAPSSGQLEGVQRLALLTQGSGQLAQYLTSSTFPRISRDHCLTALGPWSG